jgi:hypothetical protein
MATHSRLSSPDSAMLLCLQVIVFWVVAMLGSYKVLKLYGRDLVDRPQLVPIPHIHP